MKEEEIQDLDSINILIKTGDNIYQNAGLTRKKNTDSPIVNPAQPDKSKDKDENVVAIKEIKENEWKNVKSDDPKIQTY
jgi:hypothetical protein